MITVHCFEKETPDQVKPGFSVIAARYEGQWIFVRHRERRTWEIPGGHIEAGETPYDAARRELYEETGALDFSLHEICLYRVRIDAEDSYGMLYLAQVRNLGSLPESEIAEVLLAEDLPKDLTYPEIQPPLWDAIRKSGL